MDEEHGEGFMVKSEVEVVENGTRHWNGEMKLIHGRSVGGKDGDDIAFFDVEGRK